MKTRLSNRRRHIRADLAGSFEAQCTEAQGGRIVARSQFKALLKNLSVGGVFVQAAQMDLELLEPLKRKQLFVHLQGRLPMHEQPVSLLAQLCWLEDPSRYIESSKCGMGLGFVQASTQFKQNVIEWIVDQEIERQISYAR